MRCDHRTVSTFTACLGKGARGRNYWYRTITVHLHFGDELQPGGQRNGVFCNIECLHSRLVLREKAASSPMLEKIALL